MLGSLGSPDEEARGVGAEARGDAIWIHELGRGRLVREAPGCAGLIIDVGSTSESGGSEIAIP